MATIVKKNWRRIVRRMGEDNARDNSNMLREHQNAQMKM